MPKKCMICNKEAVYAIKDTSDYYCQDCAEESFADLSCLTKLEDDSSKAFDEKINPTDRA